MSIQQSKAVECKAIEFILDWNIWPRRNAEDLDSTNVRKMREALRAGFELPPIIANKKDKRIVDGFHRVTAVLKELGDDAVIMAELRNYDTDGDMLLESARINSIHGLALGPMDILHTMLKLRKMKVPFPAIAAAVGISDDRAKVLMARFTCRTDSGERLPISKGMSGVADSTGKVVTKKQEEYLRGKQMPMPINMYIGMILRAIRYDVILYNEKTYSALRELRKEIDIILEGAE